MSELIGAFVKLGVGEAEVLRDQSDCVRRAQDLRFELFMQQVRVRVLNVCLSPLRQ
jgi:hypothetical protein